MNLDDFELFRDNKNTLKNLSYDKTRDEYMTESEEVAIAFDQVKRKYCNSLQKSEDISDSVDAIYPIESGIAFIEFKNGNARQEKHKIKEKSDESIMIYCDITGQEISDTRQAAIFILVYNEENTKISPNDEKAVVMAKQSKLPYAIMGLNKHEGLCYRKIFTMNQREFSVWLNGN